MSEINLGDLDRARLMILPAMSLLDHAQALLSISNPGENEDRDGWATYMHVLNLARQCEIARDMVASEINKKIRDYDNPNKETR